MYAGRGNNDTSDMPQKHLTPKSPPNQSLCMFYALSNTYKDNRRKGT